MPTLGDTRRVDIVAPLDSMTNLLETITDEHHEVHEGGAFAAQFANTALGDNETINICFKTPAGTKRAHLIAEFTTLVGGEFELWEGPTWTTNTGNTAPTVNRLRKASMTASTLTEDKTATPSFTATNNVLVDTLGLNTTPATLIHLTHAFGIKGKVGAGGGADAEEIVLKPATTYAALFTANGGSNKGQILMHWYEHTDSN